MTRPRRPTSTSDASSLVEVLRSHAQRVPDAPLYRFLLDGEAQEVGLSFAALDGVARAIAATLQEVEVRGERAVLLYPPGVDYAAAFFGCLYAGAIAVPVPRVGRSNPRLRKVIADADPAVVLCSADILAMRSRIVEEIPDLDGVRWLATDAELADPAGWRDPGAARDTLAFLQYTSGSTSDPKGVMVSHGNLIANLDCMRRGLGASEQSIGVSWLPPFHDMGLIGGILMPMHCGFPVVLMSPLAFLRRPARWLEAITRERATMSTAPSSAYRMCVEQIGDEELAGLDLASWEVAINGAEPVRADVIESFCARFGPVGLRRSAFRPSYGLAEATLFVSGDSERPEPTVWNVRRAALQEGRAVDGDGDDAQPLVASGRPAEGVEVVIADPDLRTTCNDGRVGEIWVGGASTALGYWRRPEASEATFGARLADADGGPYLRTGDLGVLRDGELFVTGRLSDLIIIRGRNIYPQDLEATVVAGHPLLRSDRGACFAVDRDGEERLVVVQELPRVRGELDADDVIGAIRMAFSQEHEVVPAAIVLIGPQTIPRTSSGKIQRRATRAAYLDGTLDIVGEWVAGRHAAPTAATDHRAPACAGVPGDGGRRAAVAGWLQAQISARLGVAPEQVDVHQPFSYYGLDSIQAVAIAEELGAWLGRPVSSTIAWDYPTIDAAARFLDADPAAASAPVARRRALPGDRDEPLAVVGMACRLPGGVDDPDALWELLRRGGDGVREVPADRWDGAALFDPDPASEDGIYSRHAGFVDDPIGFDARFFGITPREATFMDPQQRLLLELGWAALEHAGIAPDRVAGSRTGTFVGISTTDYALMQMAAGVVDRYSGTGGAHSIAANRIAYALGLVGPSMAVDTACSSSLVAVHLACQSLRTGECELALAGGVNLMLSAETTRNFCRARMLSPTGRCRTFDAAADGYVRGEGGGFVVLKRLADVRDDDVVLAVIRGSAVNQDGRSNGLTAPNGPSQEAVIREALARAGLQPDAVDYVEAHGTGTPLGDPIELNALGRVMGAGRAPERPLIVGSVKTNIGHLEAAAGIAGLLKAILVVGRGEVPPHLHFERPNPHVAWDELALRVPTAPMALPAGAHVAGVSSFGFGGTNAHIVVESPPAPVAAPAVAHADGAPAPIVMVKVAARDEAAFAAAARRLAAFASERGDVPPAAIAREACVARADLQERGVAIGATREELVDGLRALAGARSPGVVRGRAAAGGRPQIAFLVAGQGSRYGGSARELYAREPAAARMLDRLTEVLGPLDALPLAALLEPGADSEVALARTEIAQPALYALALALGAWWHAAGVVPDAAAGHSVGAYAAAALCGALDPLDGARLVADRGRLMGELPSGGAMAAMFCGPEALGGALARHRDTLAIAAINAPQQTVLSGDAATLDRVLAELAASGVRGQRLSVSHAFHSPLVEPALDALAERLREVAFRSPERTFISDTSGAAVDDELADPAYWVRHARERVDFAGALQALRARGCRSFVELGPGATLLSFAQRTLGAQSIAALPSMDAREPAPRRLRRSLAMAWTEGATVAWRAVNPRGARVPLPTYPFQHQHHTLFEPGSAALAGEPAHVRAAAPPDSGALAGDASSGPDSTLIAALRACEPAARRRMLLARVSAEVAGVMRLGPAETIETDQGFFELGLDSLMASELQATLQRELGRELPATLALDHPTIDAVVDHVLGDVLGLAPSSTRRRRTRRAPSEEPLAIVGMACRFPGGANDLDAFWRMLRDGVDGVGAVPPSRWDADALYDPDPDAPGRMSTREGGFVDVAVDEFDAEMFGISPREAAAMDPQQRLLLEVAWEALEDAGLRAEDLAGTTAGVFVGINTSDYRELFRADGVDAYTATGNTFSVAAGRLSYVLGLEGPSLAVDTACSSSLVALHLACESLRSGESPAAFVGGVNLMLSPSTSIGMTKLRALSPDGRCKAFDASADGYGRGEGCGVLVLKRRSDALAAGDRVWALVRGSAVNQDGRSAGLTVPNGPSQVALLRAALDHAAIAPERVGYVEAHGTGTPLGDPIELQALGAALGTGRTADAPLIVGSVKTNIGHLEAAAGVAGIIKVALALHRGEIPPHLHLETPNPRVPWDRLPIVVPREPMAWPASDAPAVAGVSSFGFSGTNAHVILEQAPALAAAGASDAGAVPAITAANANGNGNGAARARHELLVLSARAPEALRELAGATAALLRAGDATLADVCCAAATRRSQLSQRVSVVAGSPVEAADRLASFADGRESRWTASGSVVARERRRVVFAYCGQGAQWAGMGTGLLAAEPVFRETVERCHDVVQRAAGWSLVDALRAAEITSRLDDTEIAQPLLFAVQAGLTALWRSRGVAPDAVVGHSAGEVAAAYAADVFELEDACRLIVERGRAMQPGRDRGRMVAVGLAPDDAATLLAPDDVGVAIAAVNGPAMTVLAGAPDAVERVRAAALERGALCRLLPGAYAFHSPQMAPYRKPLVDALQWLRPRAPTCPIFSTTTGVVAVDGDFDAEHWGANIVGSVRFADALRAAAQPGHNLVVEVGPHPVLAGAIAQCLAAEEVSGGPIASMRRGEDESATVLAALGALHVAGVAVDHRARGRGGLVRLPSYRWQRARHWLADDAGDTRGDAARAAVGARIEGCALLAREFRAARPGGERYFELDVEAGALELRIAGLATLAAGTALAVAIEAAGVALPTGTHVLRDVTLPGGVALDDEPQTLQLALGGDVPAAFELFARARGGASESVLQAAGSVERDPAPDRPPTIPSIGHVRAGLEALGSDAFYAQLAAAELVPGDGLRAIAGVWTGDGQALAELRATATGRGPSPALLESALHVLRATAGEPAIAEHALVAARIDRVVVHDRAVPARVWAHATLAARGAGEIDGDVRIYDESGHAVAELLGVHLRPPAPEILRRALDRRLDGLGYAISWPAKPRPTEAPARHGSEPGTWIVLDGGDGVGGEVVRALHARGDRCCVVRPDGALSGPIARGEVDVCEPADIRTLVAQLAAPGARPLHGVIHAWGLAPAGDAPGADEMTACARLECGALLHLAQALADVRVEAPPRIWLASRGTQPVVAEQAATPPLRAPLWGLGRVVALEHPDLWGGMIDFDVEPSPGDADTLLAEVLQPDGEDQIGYRDGERYAARLVRAAIGSPDEALRLRDDASYVVTGGRGALGLKVASWMVDHGARSLVLVGRSPLPARETWVALSDGDRDAATVAAIRALEARGARVETPAADVGDRAAMAALLRDGDPARPPVRGVVHAAGLFRPQHIAELSLADFEAVLAPKVAGTWLLHELTCDLELDFFVLFTSAASVWGSVMAGHYVAANHFQDLVAHHRRRLGLPAVAINWGWWEGSEMVPAEAKAYFAAIGLDVIPEELGFSALERLLMGPEPQRTVAPVDWRTFKPVFNARRPRPLLDLVEPVGGDGASRETSAAGRDLLRRVGAAAPARRRELVAAFLQEQVSAILGRDAAQLIDPQAGFFESGMDSIMSVQLKTRLESELGIELGATAAFEHPNIAALAAHLVDDVLDVPAGEPALADAVPDPADPSRNGAGGEPAADTTNGRRPERARLAARRAGSSPGAASALDGLSEDALLELLAGELGAEAGR